MSVASTDAAPAGGTPPAPAGKTPPGQAFNPLKRFLLLKEGSIVVVTIVAILFFVITTPHFVSGKSIGNLPPIFGPLAIVAAGEVWVMINGEIDLSVGGLYLISPFIFNEFTGAHIPLIPAMLITLIVCAALGVINGIFVSIIKVNSFVATLGTLFTLYGITLIISKTNQITTPGVSILGGGTFSDVFGGGPWSNFLWALGIVGVLQIFLSYTRWGTYTVAVGGNRLGAQEAGINEKRNMIGNFVLCATLAGFAGILSAVFAGTANPDSSAAGEFLFQVVAVAVIGGTLLTGGFGTVIGAFIGSIFLAVIQQGLVIKGVNSNYEELYLGIAILIAMTINVYIARVRVGSGSG